MKAEDYNLETYGVKHPSEFAPEVLELKEGECICGTIDCPTEYSCYTSGY